MLLSRREKRANCNNIIIADRFFSLKLFLQIIFCRRIASFCSNPSVHFITDIIMLRVTFFVIKKAKRSACHYDKCFFFASIIRANPLYPFDRIRFSVSAGRHLLPHPSAAKAGQTQAPHAWRDNTDFDGEEAWRGGGED